jgi:hypothetical protein
MASGGSLEWERFSPAKENAHASRVGNSRHVEGRAIDQSAESGRRARHAGSRFRQPFGRVSKHCAPDAGEGRVDFMVKAG